MSSQRRKSARRASANGKDHAFAVVVEQLRGDFKVFDEALQGVEARLAARIDGLQDDVGTLKLGVSALKGDVASLKVDIAVLQAAATQHTRELKGLRQSLVVVDGHERRISALEKRTD